VNTNLGRLREGELIAAVGGVVLLVAMFGFDWYDHGSLLFGEPGGGAWESPGFLGVLANLVILVAAIVAIALAVLTATARSQAIPVATSAVTAALGIAAVVLVIGRMLFQPGPNEQADVDFGIFLALIGAVMVLYGGWRSMDEEGTSFEDAREQLRARIGGRRPPPERGA
jgi:hypothetical protein